MQSVRNLRIKARWAFDCERVEGLPKDVIDTVKMLASFLVIAAMCKLIEGVTQQVAVNTKFHSYALNNFGQYNMRYKAIEASTKVRTL